MRNSLFWVMHRVVVIYCRRFGTTYPSHSQGSIIQKKRTLRMEPIGCPETSVINYHFSLSNPEGRSSHLQVLRSGSLKLPVRNEDKVNSCSWRSVWFEPSFPYYSLPFVLFQNAPQVVYIYIYIYVYKCVL